MRTAVGDVTVNTNGHARPFLHFRLRAEKGRIDDGACRDDWERRGIFAAARAPPVLRYS